MQIQGAQILAQALTSSPAKAPAADSAAAPAALHGSQAAHFRTLLQGPEELLPPSETAATPAASPGMAPVPDRPVSLGDSILQGFERVRGSLSEGWAETNKLIDPQTGPMSTQRLLQFQVRMLNMGFEYQMVTGVVTKTAQNIDQLVKMQ
jgi:hypothetical protein